MPVIINDFDIMTDSTEPPPKRGSGDGPTTPQSQPPQLRPEDIKQVMRINRDRMERVRAD
ncbi:MAG TPA: hypothetical protein VF064_19470 [Pyrinomonadaceae bacterium]